MTRPLILALIVLLAFSLFPPAASGLDVPSSDAALELERLRQENTELLDGYLAQLGAASDAERAGMADPNAWVAERLLPHVAATAERFAGTPGAVPFLLWLVHGGRWVDEPTFVRMGTETLVASHLDDERLAELAEVLPQRTPSLGDRAVQDHLATLFGGTPHDDVKAACLYATIQLTSLTDAARADALRAVIRTAPESRAAERAEAWIYELEELAIGRRVPEVEGAYVDGTPFRLSDLRGRVVLLEFWSVNCGPCRAEHPVSRERAARYADAPFIHVGVHSSRQGPDEVAAFVDEHDITWPIVVDQGERHFGPIGTRWNISGWPTTFLIDHEGVMRHTYLRGEELDAAIEVLVAEAEAARDAG